MSPVVGLVLSGGGARGAYEVGVLAGIAEALGARADGPPLFQVVAGTSVGAINGAWTVAHGHQGDHAFPKLAEVWRSLSLAEHLKLDLAGVMGLFRKRRAAQGKIGRAVLDASAIEQLVTTAVPWASLHDNLARGVMRAFIVAALHVGTGVTTLFTELAPNVDLKPMRHPRRLLKREAIGPLHVLASAAIPGVFPARRVGRAHFVDGSLRFNTPISPVIRAGAEKLVVISLKHESNQFPDLESTAAEEQYPDPVFLVGKLLNALLLDPVSYDLKVLAGLNRVLEVLDATLSPDERARFDKVLIESRGSTYRRLPTLAFEPSKNISAMAGHYLRANLDDFELGALNEWMLGRAAGHGATWESDVASYLLFDGGWADELIDLGQSDARARAAEIRAFFHG